MKKAFVWFTALLACCLIEASLSGCAKQEPTASPQQVETYRQKNIQRTERMKQEMSHKK